MTTLDHIALGVVLTCWLSVAAPLLMKWYYEWRYLGDEQPYLIYVLSSVILQLVFIVFMVFVWAAVHLINRVMQ